MKKQIILLFTLLTIGMTAGNVSAIQDTNQASVATSVNINASGVDSAYDSGQVSLTQSTDQISTEDSEEKEGLGWKIGGAVIAVLAVVLGAKFKWLPAAFDSIKSVAQAKKNKKKNSTPDPQDDTVK